MRARVGPTSHPWLIWALVAVALVATAACGSDDDEPIERTTSGDATTTSRQSTTSSVAAEDALGSTSTTVAPTATTAATAPAPPPAPRPPAPAPQPPPAPAPQPPQPPPAPPAPQPTAAITIQNFSFNPPALQVAVGTKVTATNKDSATHTWTSNDGAWDSGDLGQNAAFSHTFATAGTFSYRCDIHASMRGTVTVS